MAKNKHGHIARFGPATKHSLQGLKAAYQNEIAFKQYVWVTLVLIPLAFWLSADFIEFSLLISAPFLVLITELLNTAVEVTVDRISTERHELSGRAKDLGSAAVFIALVYFLLVWGYKLFTIF